MKTLYFKKWFISVCCFVLLCFNSCSKDESISDLEQLEEIKENEENKEDVLDISEEILQLVNIHRVSLGMSALISNNLAVQLANEHTLYMIGENKISHDNFSDRADRLFDEKAVKVGENVAAKQRTAQEVMDDWLDSPGHRENIEGDFTHIGISVIKNSRGQYYFTQLFLKL